MRISPSLKPRHGTSRVTTWDGDVVTNIGAPDMGAELELCTVDVCAGMWIGFSVCVCADMRVDMYVDIRIDPSDVDLRICKEHTHKERKCMNLHK